MNIYLIGMPGVGKSTLGKELSKKLNYNFIDTDKVIEETTNKTIKELFVDEKEFRKIEFNTIFNLRNVQNTVVSLGGGSILNKDNIDNLYGIIIYLNVSLEELNKRIDISTRPLLQKTSLEKLYIGRKSLYESYSDYTIINDDLDNSINNIIDIVNRPKKNVLVINGPNLNMLGQRDENNYGSLTLSDINQMMSSYDIFNYDFFQSNIEGEIVNEIHKLKNYDYLIINPAAYTHTSVAIHDALEIFNIPKVEVHLSDVDNREIFRKNNLIKGVCSKTIVNNREFSYLDAINYLKKINL